MQTNLTVIKKEEKGEKAIAVRPRDTKGKDKEPVRQTAREEENVENNDHLFSMIGLLTTKGLSILY